QMDRAGVSETVGRVFESRQGHVQPPNSTMTSPSTPKASKIDTPSGADTAERAQTFLDWTRINSRAITIGALTVAVAAALYAYIARSRAIESENAAKALLNAKQSLS